MIKLYSRNNSYINDKYTIDNICNEKDLIYKAGHALYISYTYDKKTLVVVGKGNNGSDGLALAIELKKNNKDVSILLLYEFNKDILLDLINKCKSLNIPIYKYDDSFNFNEYKIIVDGIFGIGYKSNKLDNYISLIIDKINNSKAYIISIDINSGLDSDSGKAINAIKSNLTIAINSFKYGHFLNDAKDYIDKLIAKDIGIINNSFDNVYLVEESDINNILKHRLNNVNKGSFGYVGIMGGSKQYIGSVKLSNLSLSSLISGAGVSRLIVPSYLSSYLYPTLLQSTLYPIKSNFKGQFRFNKKQINNSIKGLKSLVVGMGMGVSKSNRRIIKYILNNYSSNLIIDADGLNNLAYLDLNLLNKSKASIILTPHVKEFSRPINKSVEEILNNPIKYALDFTNKYNVCLLLKGTSSIIAYKSNIYIINKGSNALAKGGSGDILDGIIVGMCGYNNILDGLLASSYIFGKVGENCKEKYGSYCCLPSDIIKELKEFMKNY